MKSNAKTVFVSALIGTAIALFPYLLDVVFPPDPRSWMWIPLWEWLRLPGELIAGGATPNMAVVNTINVALYSVAAYPLVSWRVRRKSLRTRPF